jgi:hypothetical protein
MIKKDKLYNPDSDIIDLYKEKNMITEENEDDIETEGKIKENQILANDSPSLSSFYKQIPQNLLPRTRSKVVKK